MVPGEMMIVKADTLTLWNCHIDDYMEGKPWLITAGTRVLVIQNIAGEKELLVLANGLVGYVHGGAKNWTRL